MLSLGTCPCGTTVSNKKRIHVVFRFRLPPLRCLPRPLFFLALFSLLLFGFFQALLLLVTLLFLLLLLGHYCCRNLFITVFMKWSQVNAFVDACLPLPPCPVNGNTTLRQSNNTHCYCSCSCFCSPTPFGSHPQFGHSANYSYYAYYILFFNYF